MSKQEILQRIRDIEEFLNDGSVEEGGFEYDTAVQEFDELWALLAELMEKAQ